MKQRHKNLLVVGLLLTGTQLHLHAQLVADGGTANITNGINLWPGNLTVGTNGGNTTLNIIAPGVVTNRYGYVGFNDSSDNNTVTVQDSGAVWTNSNVYVGYYGSGNQLIISNGGEVLGYSGDLGYFASSSNNVAVVTGPGSSWGATGSSGSSIKIGYFGGGNQLIITNGAFVASNYGGIGNSGDNNGAVLTGPGSSWIMGADFSVGNYGNGNQLIVSNGATVSDLNGYVGYNLPGYDAAGANNVALVTGSGSSWTNTGEFHVGSQGAGNLLVVSNGAVVVNNTGYLGFYYYSSNNIAVVTGLGSHWRSSSDLYVGRFGSGNQLIVSDGASVAGGHVHLGVSPSSVNNVAVVTGSGSSWTNSGDFTLGVESPGNQLVVSNGAVVVNNTGYLGSGISSSNNTAVVTGPGSSWTNSGSLHVGYDGDRNHLIITNGGRVWTASGGEIGLGFNFDSDSNTVLVTGADSLWSMGANLNLGSGGGLNQMVISDGAMVANGVGTIGSASSSNSVVVTGSGSIWTNRNSLLVGYYGDFNQLTINNGGAVASSGGLVSGGTGYGPNFAEVTGAGSRWDAYPGNLGVGANADAELIISNGAVVTCFAGDVGPSQDFGPFSGHVTVTGSGSLWQNSFRIRVGSVSGDSPANRSELVISDGATVASGTGYIGDLSGNGNRVEVTGAGSTWTNSSSLYVGNGAYQSELLISNGASVFSANGYLGNNASSSNNVAVVTGAGSSLNSAGQLYVGYSGSGNQLVVSNGASVASYFGLIGQAANSSNNVAVVTGPGSSWSNSGNLSVGASGSGNQLIVSNGAVVADSFDAYLGYDSSSSDNVAMVTGLGSTWSNGFSISVGYYGSGNTLIIAPGGTVQAANAYVGVFSESTDNLLRLDDGTLITPGGTEVRSGNTLAGSGTISGSVTVASGATLSPGASIGSLVLSNSPALQGNVVMEISKTGATLTNDVIHVLASLNYGGTLTVSNLGPDVLADGDSFPLFSATSYGGEFTSLTLPSPGSGLMWTNRLLFDGSIAIVPLTAPSIRGLTKPGTNLVFNVGDGSPGGAYDVLTSTNVALPLSSWTTNSSGNFDWLGNTAITNGVDLVEPQRFFTIRVP